MANHVRTQIRDAVKTLVTGLASTGARAYAARPQTRPLQDAELPGWLVYTNDEESERSTMGALSARRLERVLDVVLEGYIKSTADADALLDTMCKEAEAAIAADVTLGGLAKDCVLARTEKGSAAEAEQPTWRVRQTWRVEYHTRENVPDAALA